MPPTRLILMVCAVLLTSCSSERHFARDSWPIGNPNRPPAASENARVALGHTPVVDPIAPQAGDVWPGPVQPVPTIADEQKAMSQPLGSAYTPSLPSPYPPGMEPAPNPDLGEGPLGPPGSQSFSEPDTGGASGSDLAPLTGPLTVPSQ